MPSGVAKTSAPVSISLTSNKNLFFPFPDPRIPLSREPASQEFQEGLEKAFGLPDLLQTLAIPLSPAPARTHSGCGTKRTLLITAKPPPIALGAQHVPLLDFSGPAENAPKRGPPQAISHSIIAAANRGELVLDINASKYKGPPPPPPKSGSFPEN